MSVSIVIVCMNNIKNIYPCLNSIKKYTSIDYEVLLVAYKFSEENMRKLITDFPWITIIESQEIRGFSENNNLALKQAKGDFCFVLNDDTYFETPVVDMLYNTMIEHSDIDILSPNLYYPDGRVQFLGRPKLNARKFILTTLKIWGEKNMRNVYHEKKGIYDIYNISGAAFMIKTDVFKTLGWFDENYFFSPEDIALSTLAKQKGYRICQNSDIHITHIASATSSPISAATLPASFKGHLMFYSNYNKLKFYLLCIIESPLIITKCCVYKILSWITHSETHKIYANAEFNTLVSIWNNETPKEIFTKFYTKIVTKKDDESTLCKR